MARYTLSVANEVLENVYIDRSLNRNKPSKNVQTIKIPGRNGDLVIDYGTFDNITITYPCFIHGNFDATFTALMNKLASYKGYQKIKCSDDVQHYRMGIPIIQVAPTVKRIGEDGFFDLSFNCKPQRYLGEQWYSTTASSVTIDNPNKFESRPLIRVQGEGTFTLNGTTVTVGSSAAGEVYIDCDLMRCYYEDTNLNSIVSFSTKDFPTLAPGANVLTKSGSITKILVLLQFWEL